MSSDLRYPVGRYLPPEPISAAHRPEWIEQIARAPAALREAVRGLSDAQLDTPYRPGGWTVRQVVHHVPDSHLNAYTRFKLALTEDEPTIKPYDTEWYGQDAAYNYACIFDYLSHYYDVGRLEPKNRPADDKRKELPASSVAISQINSAALRDCDVLVLKTPTADFSPEEVQAIEQFVKRGGGLFLVGEHTDVFGTGRHLNSVAREFGFAFRHDCLFAIDHVPSGPGTTPTRAGGCGGRKARAGTGRRALRGTRGSRPPRAPSRGGRCPDPRSMPRRWSRGRR